jgi:hypothetical protein
MNAEIFERGDMLNGTNMSFIKSFFLDDIRLKIVMGTLGAVISSLADVASELMWTVMLLVLCDFLLGCLRAVRDPKVKMKWAEALNTGIKVLIIGVGVCAVHFVEMMILQATDMDFHGTLELGFLFAVGAGETVSILDHLSYHFSGFKSLAERVKRFLVKELNGED